MQPDAIKAIARFFVDENLLALGKLIAISRREVVYPGHPSLPEVPLGSRDEDWLAVVGRRDLVVITRDKKLRSRPVERQRLVATGVRTFVLTRAGDITTRAMHDLLESHWAPMEAYVATHPKGPWLAAITKAGIRPLHLRE